MTTTILSECTPWIRNPRKTSTRMTESTLFCLLFILAIFVQNVNSTSICDLPQCRCLVTFRGSDVMCNCLNGDQRITLASDALPGNTFNLTIENCESVGVAASLSSIHLRTINFRGIKDLRIPHQSFLSNLRQLSSFILEDTKIPNIPSFSFSSLRQVLNIQFKNAEIGTISSDAFSDLMHVNTIKFSKSKINDIERNAFGRGTSKIDNLIMEETDIDIIHERGIWLEDSEIVHFDKCNIRKIAANGIRLNNAFFFYLTRSSIQNYEAGGISGVFYSGVMIDNDYLNPVKVNNEEPGPLFDLKESRQRGSSVAPFFHFTNNVLTKILPDHAFFISNPTINVAVPNNTLGDCSCSDYRNYLRSLKPILDDYTLNINQALVEHGICLVDQQIFSIGCPDLSPPVFAGPSSKNIRIPSRELAPRIKTKTRADKNKTPTLGPNAIAKDVQVTTSRNLAFRPVTQPPVKIETTTRARPTTRKLPSIARPTTATPTTQFFNAKPPTTTAVTPLKQNNSVTKPDPIPSPPVTVRPANFIQAVTPREANPRTVIGQPVLSPIISTTDSPQELLSVPDRSFFVPAKSSVTTTPFVQPPPVEGKSIDSADTKTVWNEIFGGIFAQRLRRPLPDAFPTAQPSVKFAKIMKPLELRRFQKGNLFVVSPR